MKGGPGFPGDLQASFTAGVPEASSAGRMVKMNGGPGRLSREVRLRIKDVPVAGGYAILRGLVPGPGGAAGPGRSVGPGGGGRLRDSAVAGSWAGWGGGPRP